MANEHADRSARKRRTSSGTDGENKDYRGANLRGARFRNRDLSGADFTGADIRGTDFRGAKLAGAIFTGARAGRRLRATLAQVLVSIPMVDALMFGAFWFSGVASMALLTPDASEKLTILPGLAVVTMFLLTVFALGRFGLTVKSVQVVFTAIAVAVAVAVAVAGSVAGAGAVSLAVAVAVAVAIAGAVAGGVGAAGDVAVGFPRFSGHRG